MDEKIITHFTDSETKMMWHAGTLSSVAPSQLHGLWFDLDLK